MSDLPVTMKATITFRTYDPDGEYTMALPERIRRCIETHPSLSFAIDDVVVEFGSTTTEMNQEDGTVDVVLRVEPGYIEQRDGTRRYTHVAVLDREEDRMGYLISSDDLTVVAETEKAIRVVPAGTAEEGVWVPKSQIHDDSEVSGSGDSGRLVISQWIYDQDDGRMDELCGWSDYAEEE